jgi:hypothetical protein
MSARAMARGATPVDPREFSARGTTPFDPRERRGLRIRDAARDGLSAAAVSLAGSVGVTATLSVILRWLG